MPQLLHKIFNRRLPKKSLGITIFDCDFFLKYNIVIDNIPFFLIQPLRHAVDKKWKKSDFFIILATNHSDLAKTDEDQVYLMFQRW